MSKSKRGTAIAGVILGAVVVAVAVLSWNAGGPQVAHEISQAVAVPELQP